MIERAQNIVSIPAGLPFAATLADYLLEKTAGKPENLASYKILLPTRRACRTLQESFLRQSGGKALLLPCLQPLGDVDEDELSLTLGGGESLNDFLNLPPSISPLRRQILLARTIEKKPDFKQGFDQALILAKALGHLMDQIYTEGLQIKDMADLVPDEFANHWQITLKFLEILSVEWPNILAESGVIDVADRRNRLIRALNAFWQDYPPETPVIAAGSTGSIPATAELLKTIASLPQGQVILPGLDTEMDEESWAALEESHFQFGLKQLLERMDIPRNSVRVEFKGKEQASERRILAGEMMRPASTAFAWTALGQDKNKKIQLQKALENLALYECAHEREEAELIAILMRETLEKPGKTAALITPDRALARRVQAAVGRWDIALDDSAGQSLHQTQTGAFIRLVFEAALEGLSPVSLLSLLKHPFCHAGLDREVYAVSLEKLERNALRGLRPSPGFTGLEARIQHSPLLEAVKPILEKLCLLCGSRDFVNFHVLMSAHLEACERLSAPGILWSGEEGQAASRFFAELMEQNFLVPAIQPQSYIGILEPLLSGVAVRPAYGMHPRLMILGQLEARLIDADLVILGGLNEGTWPADPGHDPWMSRPMRQSFGLPASERSIGLAAHDFVQGLCAPRVALTRSCRSEGVQTVPARWLQRFDAVLQAAELPRELLTCNEALEWVKNIDSVEEILPVERPAPCPPVESRPRRLSVTKIEIWLKDPYAIYARYILGLAPLDELDKEPDAALRGEVLHEILERFMSAYPKDLPENALEALQKTAQSVLEEYQDDPALWSFWWPRFYKIGNWLISHEQKWRKEAVLLKTEIKGELNIETPGGGFTLSGIADRIDRLSDGTAALIDYKSGGSYTQKGIKEGDMPQLPLEALILSEGGFPGLSPMKTGFMGYWVLTGGGEQAGKITAINAELEPVVENAKEGLQALILCFENPETPYLCLPNAGRVPRFNDYEHLARVKEWIALDSAEEQA